MFTQAGFELTPSGCRSIDWYPEGVRSNPIQVNIFQLTLAV